MTVLAGDIDFSWIEEAPFLASKHDPDSGPITEPKPVRAHCAPSLFVDPFFGSECGPCFGAAISLAINAGEPLASNTGQHNWPAIVASICCQQG